MEIKGTIALITGASQRLGRAIAVELGRRGGRIAIHHRSTDSESDARETLRLVHRAGGDGAVFPAELRDQKQLDNMFEAIRARFGVLHILVNSASVFSPASADETSEA